MGSDINGDEYEWLGTTGKSFRLFVSRETLVNEL